jgi:putative ABC transport system permease protein
VTALEAYGDKRAADFAPSISSVIADRFVGFTSIRMHVKQTIGFVYLRNQDGVVDNATLVDGKWPTDRGMALKQTFFGQPPGSTEPPAIFEAALSTTSAQLLGAHVGDLLNMELDKSDTIVPTSTFAIAPTQIEVVGLFEPNDEKAGMWDGSGLLQPTLKRGRSGVEGIWVTGYVPPESYARLAASGLPFRFDWRYQVDASDLDANLVDTLQPDLRKLDLIATTNDRSVLPEVGSTVSLANITIRTGLLGVLDRFDAQRARSESVLSIAVLGPLGLAAGAIAMLAVLIVRPRRPSLLLARGRGASGGLLLGAQLVEALVVAGGAALIGYGLAVAFVPARDAPLSLILAFGVAAAGTLFLVGATWPSARRPLIQLERDDPRIFRVATRRLVIEAAIVGVAILAVVLLRQRGLTLGGDGTTAQFDPLLAAVPVLAGLAAGIVLMRLYPLPIRALGWLAARRRDMVPVTGLRTVSRRPASANLPILVLMLTAAFGAFASVIESSIDRGQVASSYLDVGADYRLDAVGVLNLPPALDPTTIPGIEAAARGLDDPTAAYVNQSANQRAGINLLAIDPVALERVTANTAAARTWPSSFEASPSVVDVGTASNPIPAIVSDDFPPGTDSLGIGSTFTVSVNLKPVSFKLIGRGANVPGIADTDNFMIVPLDWLTATEPGKTLLPTMMWLRGSTDAAAPLAAAVNAASSGVRVVSRQDSYLLLHDAPLGSAVADGFGIALTVSILYLVMTLVGAVIISAAGHTRDLAYLRTLGVSGRQARGLTAVEHLPPVLLALIPGIVLGVLVAQLVEPGLGLAEFQGAQGLPLYVDWRTLLLVIVALTAIVIVAILIGTWLAGRARLANTLRIEDS